MNILKKKTIILFQIVIFVAIVIAIKQYFFDNSKPKNTSEGFNVDATIIEEIKKILGIGNKSKLEDLASKENKIILFENINYTGKPYLINIPNRSTTGYYNMTQQKILELNPLNKPAPSDIGEIQVRSVIIPDNIDYTDSKFRNIDLYLQTYEESENLNNGGYDYQKKSIKQSTENITTIHDIKERISNYEIRPLIQELDIKTASQILNENEIMMGSTLNRLKRELNNIIDKKNEKTQQQNNIISDLSKRSYKNMDKILSVINYKLLNKFNL